MARPVIEHQRRMGRRGFGLNTSSSLHPVPGARAQFEASPLQGLFEVELHLLPDPRVVAPRVFQTVPTRSTDQTLGSEGVAVLRRQCARSLHGLY